MTAAAAAPASPVTPALPASRVRLQDRVVDGIAALLLVGGVALFFLGRSALMSIAAGTYPAPLGETWVARAEFHDSQTRLGMWLVAAGVTVGLAAATRHLLHRRRSR